jgi:hypothetical protein
VAREARGAHRRRRQPTAIYDKLRTEQKDPAFEGSLSVVKRMYAWIRADKGISPNGEANDVAIPVDTEPGHVGQVDFGSVGKLWDPMPPGLRLRLRLRLRLLAPPVRQAGIQPEGRDLARAARRGLRVLQLDDRGHGPRQPQSGGAAFDVRTEPVLNRGYRELARHYGFQVDPTPPYVKHNFMTTTGEERDVAVLNPRLTHWLLEIAGHGTTHKQPLKVFEQIEKAKMLPLPTVRREPISWRQPMVQRDCHALIEGARYSAP